MSVYLINGDGNPKVTASQDADWYGAMTGEKTAILPMNDSFEYSILSNNLISIGSGVLVTREGRRVQIDNNDSIEIAIPSGAVGSNSYYIVGFRLYIDTDGTQKAEGFCQTMTSATETITETAFKEGSSTVYVSLYRITKVGVDIDSTDLLLPIFVGLVDKANQVSICSDIETVNSSASKSYSIGKYFWNTLTNKLRRVTSAISSGSTITDSNSTETTVADELSRINTELTDYFQVVTGTLSNDTTTPVKINYPTGFNSTNTYVLETQIYWANSYWISNYVNKAVCTVYELRSDGIYVYSINSASLNKPVRMLLKRMNVN